MTYILNMWNTYVLTISPFGNPWQNHNLTIMANQTPHMWRISLSTTWTSTEAHLFFTSIIFRWKLFTISLFLLGHMCFTWLRTYVVILCNWLILWQNALYLYLGRFRMCLNTSRNYVSRSSFEAFKSVQENKLIMQIH